MITVAPASVVDTSDDPAHVPFRVDVTVSEPVIGIEQQPLYLDGPLSWCAFLDAGDVPPARDSDEWIDDFRLPLATWVRPGTPYHPNAAAADGGVWGWCVSRAVWTAQARTAVHMRRMPNVEAMARFTSARRFHPGLGTTKARNTLSEAVWPGVITWYALGDPSDVERLLNAHLTHIGRNTRHGNGAIATITVSTEGVDRNAWRDRDWDDPYDAVRAPYSHPSRRQRC